MSAAIIAIDDHRPGHGVQQGTALPRNNIATSGWDPQR
jgi:hypothetical protein